MRILRVFNIEDEFRQKIYEYLYLALASFGAELFTKHNICGILLNKR